MLPMTAMRFDRLSDWLAWQETLNPHHIDLGLERVAAIWAKIGRPCLAEQVITVAGTNGKGSCVAMLAAILAAAGYRVGTYTSPHLLRYNERICLDGQAVTDEELCDAFERVDQARGRIALTYFEFGTLAALDIFQRHSLDVVVLEVGLGGRLDAVNIIDADVALITTIAQDHIEWLGSDLATIAAEKAGIFRHGRAAVCADPQCHAVLQDRAESTGARLYCPGRDYDIQRLKTGEWHWRSMRHHYDYLPAPALHGAFQYHNAAGVLMVLEQLSLNCSEESLRQGLRSVALAGRFQLLPQSDYQVIVDVAHNVQAASALAQTLQHHGADCRVRLVIAMLADKDVDGVLAALVPVVDDWYIAGLALPRGLPAGELAAHLPAGIVPRQVSDNLGDVLQQAMQQAGQGDQLVICGSFYTASHALQALAADETVGAGA